MINYLTADLCEVLAKYDLELTKLEVTEELPLALERPDESQVVLKRTFYIKAKETRL